MSEPGAPPLRIGLLWHALRAGNLGVGALTLADVAIIRGVADELGISVDFTVISMRETYTAPILDDAGLFEMNARSLLSPGRYARMVGDLDCVIDIGAGDSFAEIYGPKRFGFMWLSKIITMARGVPLILAPQTIGPFEGHVYKWLARIAMERAKAVIARDPASLDAARAIAPCAEVHLAVDVAFLMPFADRSAERGGAKIRVGVNASGLLCTQAETAQNRFGLSYDNLRLNRRLIEAWLERGDVEVHLVTHANSNGDSTDDDGHRADRLAQEFPAAIRVPDFAGPAEAKSYISSLDFLIAGRMHACVGAFSSGTAVVPLAYSRKFAGLFGMLGYDWMVPVTGMTEDDAFAYVMKAFEQRAVLTADEARGMNKVEALTDAYRDVLRRELGALAQARR